MSSSVRLRSSLLGLALVLLLGACSSSDSPDPGQPGATGAEQVGSTTLTFEDTTRPTVPDPATGSGRTDSRELPTTLWFPEDGDGPFPVVVFSHGRDSSPEAYAELLSSWAAAGFVVAAPRFPLTSQGSPLVVDDVVNQSADVSFVLTQVLALDTTDGSPLEGRIDADHVAVAGHSAGAVTTIGLLTDCCTDPRVDAAVLLAGASVNYILPGYTAGQDVRFTTPGLPALFVHGAADEAIPIEQGRAVYQVVPGPKAFVTLDEGTHSAPYDDPTDPSWDTVRAVTTDYLQWVLDGDTTGLDRLRTDADSSGTSSLSDDRLVP